MLYFRYIIIFLLICTNTLSLAQCPPGTTPVGPNIVVNGDFSMGDTGFVSGYTPGTGGTLGPISNPTQYAIVNNPNVAHYNFASFGDHTTGSGQMMVINGSTIPNKSIWCQTVAIQPFTTYTFSTWIASAIASNPANLQFSINGFSVGTFTASLTTGQWQEFSIDWYSSTQTSANICISNLNTSSGGNDFAIDDIWFQKCECLVPATAGPTTTICPGESVQLFASGGHTYKWFPSTGLSNDTIANPVATITTNTLYYVIVLSSQCIDTVSVAIDITPLPQVNAGIDDTLCAGSFIQLSGSGTGNISWLPASGLSNPSILNPVASPLQTTEYILTVEAAGCENTDTMTVTVNPRPVVDAGVDVSICQGDSVQLIGNGAGIISWAPSTGLSDPTILNPIAKPSQTTVFLLSVDSGGCQNIDTVNVTVISLPQANAGNDVAVCAGDSILLNGSGTAGQVSWSPSSGINDPGIINPLASPTQNIIYILTIEANGCVNKDSVLVTVKPKPLMSAGIDLSLCEGDTIQINGSGNGIISWSPSTGLNSPNIINPLASPSQTSTYILSVDSGGCVSVDSMTVEVIILPQVDAGIHDTICAGTSVQIDGQGTGIISWSPITGLNNPSIINPLVSPTQTTQYYLTVLSNGCANTDSVIIFVKPLPQISAAADVSICEGDSVQLNGSGSGIISWLPSNSLNNPDVINPIASPLQTTIYVLTVDSGGCESVDSVSVAVIPLPLVNAGVDETICAESSIQLSASGATEYIWSPSIGLNSYTVSDPIASPIVTTTYLISGTKNGCTSFDTITVFVNQLPIVVAGNDTVLNYKINFPLTGFPANGNWFSAKSGLLCTGCTNYQIITDQNQEYYYHFMDSVGCENSDTINIIVNKTCPEPFFPNAFTPNNDFINDIYKPVLDNKNVITNVEFIIYDRWGEQVFNSKSLDEGWDGKSVNINKNMDMFLYKLIYNCEGNTKIVNGRFMLLK